MLLIRILLALIMDREITWLLTSSSDVCLISSTYHQYLILFHSLPSDEWNRNSRWGLHLLCMWNNQLPFHFQYEELLTNVALPNLPTKDEKDLVVSAMNESHGDLAKASLELFKPLKSLDMLNHIWQEEDSQNYTNYEKFISDKSYHLVADEKLPKMVSKKVVIFQRLVCFWFLLKTLSLSIVLIDTSKIDFICRNVSTSWCPSSNWTPSTRPRVSCLSGRNVRVCPNR